MAGRIRTLKPELLEDDKTGRMDDAAFRMFVGMILLADDHGNLRGAPEWIAAQVWWGSTPSRDPRETLARLSEQSLVTLYESGGQPYAHITNWARHQKVDHPSKPRMPCPHDEGSRIVAGDLATVSRDLRESLAPHTSDLRPPITDRGPFVLSTQEPGNEPAPLEPDQPKPKRKPRKGTMTSMPPDWAPTEAHREQAKAKGVDLDFQAQKFRNTAEAKGYRYVNWTAAFTNWLDSDYCQPQRMPPRLVQPPPAPEYRKRGIELTCDDLAQIANGTMVAPWAK